MERISITNSQTTTQTTTDNSQTMDFSHDILTQIGEDVRFRRNYNALLGELTEIQEEWDDTEPFTEDDYGYALRYQKVERDPLTAATRPTFYHFFRESGYFLSEYEYGEEGYACVYDSDNLGGGWDGEDYDPTKPIGFNGGFHNFRPGPMTCDWEDASNFRAQGQLVIVPTEGVKFFANHDH